MPYTEHDIKEIESHKMVPIAVFRSEEDKAFSIFSKLCMATSLYKKNSNITLEYYNVANGSNKNMYQVYAYYKKPAFVEMNKDLKNELKVFLKGFLMALTWGEGV